MVICYDSPDRLEQAFSISPSLSLFLSWQAPLEACVAMEEVWLPWSYHAEDTIRKDHTELERDARGAPAVQPTSLWVSLASHSTREWVSLQAIPASAPTANTRYSRWKLPHWAQATSSTWATTISQLLLFSVPTIWSGLLHSNILI